MRGSSLFNNENFILTDPPNINCPWELLYADDLGIMSDNLEDLKIQLQAWKTSLDTLGVRINVGNTKIHGSLCDKNVKWPCGVCSKEVDV